MGVVGGSLGVRDRRSEGDLHSPQLWIDQDRLLFLRALEPDPTDTTKTLEYRFDNYKLEADGWLSETVLELRDGKQFFREDYANVRNEPATRPE